MQKNHLLMPFFWGILLAFIKDCINNHPIKWQFSAYRIKIRYFYDHGTLQWYCTNVQTPKNNDFCAQKAVFEPDCINNHPLILQKIEFSMYFTSSRVIFKGRFGSNSVPGIPSALYTVLISSKNGRKSSVVENNTPMGFWRSLGYNRFSLSTTW